MNGATNGVPRLALPNKGRLAEPALQLLHDSGLDVEISERSLSARVRNVPLELLFVRAEDVPEYVADGLVEAGLTGYDLVSERAPQLSQVLELGFGGCSLVVAVPTAGEIEEVVQLDGCRVATTFPRVTGQFFAERGVQARIIEVHGAVEVTPQLGVSDAVVDLVASGSTLRRNGLRPIATLLESQAVLVAPERGLDERLEPLVAMVRSVVDARGKEYVMMNAPASALEEIRRLIPGMAGPTVMPLADRDMIAVHSVVERTALWELVPALQSVGARDILVLPIEKVIR